MPAFWMVFLIAISVASCQTRTNPTSRSPDIPPPVVEKISQKQTQVKEALREARKSGSLPPALEELAEKDDDLVVEAASVVAADWQNKDKAGVRSSHPLLVGGALLGSSLFVLVFTHRLTRSPFRNSKQGKWNLNQPFLKKHRLEILKHSSMIHFLDFYDRVQTGWFIGKFDDKAFPIKIDGSWRGVWYEGVWTWAYKVQAYLPVGQEAKRSNFATWVSELRGGVLDQMQAALSKEEKIKLAQWIKNTREKLFLRSATVAAEDGNYALANLYRELADTNPFAKMDPIKQFDQIYASTVDYATRQESMTPIESDLVDRYIRGPSPLKDKDASWHKSQWEKHVDPQLDMLEEDYFLDFAKRQEARYQQAKSWNRKRFVPRVLGFSFAATSAALGSYFVYKYASEGSLSLQKTEDDRARRKLEESVGQLVQAFAR